MLITGNFHTHTSFCDGKDEPRKYVEEAIKKQMTHLGFSGHMDADVHMDFEQYAIEINTLRAEYEDKIQILCGIELDALYKFNKSDKVDYIIGSTHFLDVEYDRPLSIDDTPEDVVLLCNTFFHGDYLKLARAYYELEAQVYDRTKCTFVGHFDLLTKFNDQLHMFDENSIEYLDPALEAMSHLVKQGIPIEVNTRQSHRGKLFPNVYLLTKLREMGGEIILSSDAHTASDLLKGFDYAISIIKQVGFKHINILHKGSNIQFKQIAII